MKVKFMTFNIQHGRNYHFKDRDCIDLQLMADTVNSQNVDFVGFEEVRGKGQTEFFPNEPYILSKLIKGSRRFGKAIDVKGGGPYGNLFISRFPIIKSRKVMIPDCVRVEGERGYESRCIIESVIDCNGKPLTVLVSHFGLRQGEQVNAVDTALSLVRKSRYPVVLMGDFNMTPDNPLIKKISSEMTDVSVYTGTEGFTYASDDPKIKIDYIFVKDAKIIESHIVKVIASDHFPMTAVIDI